MATQPSIALFLVWQDDGAHESVFIGLIKRERQTLPDVSAIESFCQQKLRSAVGHAIASFNFHALNVTLPVTLLDLLASVPAHAAVLIN